MQISIDNIVLKSGAHGSRDDGTCFMEAAAYIAGEAHSDHPACICPVYGEFARRFNDYLGDGDRQKMKPYLRFVIGTATDGFADRRSWMIIDWSIREVLAVYCEAQNLKDFARDLRGLREICDWPSAQAASEVLNALDLALDLALARARDLARNKKVIASGFALMDRLAMIGVPQSANAETPLSAIGNREEHQHVSVAEFAKS